MGSTWAVPGNGPWDIRLSAPDADGVYRVELRDPTAGGVQAGPFLLRFPSVQYAWQWFSAHAEPIGNTGARDLAGGTSFSGTAQPSTWGPMISALYHAAEVTQRLASPWWYGSYPNWAETDPLLPQASSTSADPAPDGSERETQIFGVGLFTCGDLSKPVLRVDWLEATVPLPGGRHWVRLTPFDHDPVVLGLRREPRVDQTNREVHFDTIANGDASVRVLRTSDSSAISRFDIGHDKEMLECVLETSRKAFIREKRILIGTEPEWHDALLVLVGPGSDEAFAVQYLVAMDSVVQGHWWLNTDDGQGWSDEVPLDSEAWQAERVRRGLEPEQPEDDEGDDDLTIWQGADAFSIDASFSKRVCDAFPKWISRSLPCSRSGIRRRYPDQVERTPRFISPMLQGVGRQVRLLRLGGVHPGVTRSSLDLLRSSL